MSFAEVVERQAALYFDVLLPRYLARWYRGGGYELVARLLAKLDDDTFDAPLADPEPPRRYRRRAARVRKNCPLFVGRGRPDLLGRFFSAESYVRYNVGIYETRESSRYVEIYEDGFATLAFSSPEALARAVLHTIVHEYLHFFESFLFRSEQALRGREELDPAVRHLTIGEAALRDDRVVWRRRVFRGFLAAVALVLLGYAGWRGVVENGEDPPRLAKLQSEITRLAAERDRLAEVRARPEPHRQRLERVDAALAALRAEDLAFSPSQVRASLNALAAPAVEVRPLGYGDGFELRGPHDGWLPVLDRAARALPTLRLGLVRAEIAAFTAELHPRSEAAAAPAPSLDRLLKAPVFESEAGATARRDARRLDREIADLRAALGPLAAVAAREDVLARTRAAGWGGDALGSAACLVIGTALGRGGWAFHSDRASYYGNLRLPARVAADVECPSGRWLMAAARRSMLHEDHLFLDYRFLAAPAPRPYSSAMPAVLATKLVVDR